MRGGDHLPFLNRGYAAVRFTEPFENYMHQHQNVRIEGGQAHGDLPEFVDPAYVADVARINLVGLVTLALAPAAPRQRLSRRLARDRLTCLAARPGCGSGPVSRVTLPGLSKDKLVFGVQAVGAGGHASPASFPLPMR